MINKKNLLVILIVILSLTIIGLVGFNIYKKYNKIGQENDTIIYRLTYYDDGEPGSKSEINISGNNITINTTNFCSAVDCKATTETIEYTYSKENADKLKDFIKTLNDSKLDLNNLNPTILSKDQIEIIRSIIYGENLFEITIEEYQYKIEYTETKETEYIIYFKKDSSILVKKIKLNKEHDIVNSYFIKFKDENMKILNDYAKKQAEFNKTNIIYKQDTLYKDEENIIKSIIENNESYLNNENNVKLAYNISFEGIECDTPILRLYTDNTYQFYDTSTIYGDTIIPKTGTYNYDLTKLINNINNYSEDSYGIYYITDNENHKYSTYSSNIELNELLNSLNITLNRCTTIN